MYMCVETQVRELIETIFNPIMTKTINDGHSEKQKSK